MEGKQSRSKQGRDVVTKKSPDQEVEQNRYSHVLNDAEQVPSPRGHSAEDEVRPHPNDKYRPIVTLWAAGKLGPHIVCEIFPNMTRGLHTRIVGETVVVQNEVVLQRRSVNGEYASCQGQNYD